MANNIAPGRSTKAENRAKRRNRKKTKVANKPVVRSASPAPKKTRKKEKYEDSYDSYDKRYEEEYEDDYYEDSYDEYADEYDGAYDDEYADEYDDSYDDEYADEYDDSYDDEYADEYDEGYDDSYDDEYEDEYEPKGVGGIAGIWNRIRNWFENLTSMDMILIGGGALVVAALITVGVYFFTTEFEGSRLTSRYAKVGKELEDVDIIGAQGIQAVMDAMDSQVVEVAEEVPEEELDEDGNPVTPVSETDSSGRIAVVMNLTSIQRDLKIKFVNNNTQKLITGVSFEISITDPSGSKITKTNTDRDGIIYLSGITPGKYQVALVGPDDKTLNYLKDPVTIQVKDTIEYKKVDVTAEIKKESEVNVAKEDTAVNDTAVESSLSDTVEWVESSKTLIEGSEDGYTYEKVEHSDIEEPNKVSGLGLKFLGRKLEPDENATASPEATESAEASPSPTGEATATPTDTPSPSPTPTETPSPSPTPTETPSPSPSPSVTPSASPSPSASASASPSVSPSASPTASPDLTKVLKNKKGETLYIKDGDKYKEATVADYYKNGMTFYRKVEGSGNAKYKYTGWQNIDGHTYYYDKNGKYVTGEQVIQGAKYNFDSEGRLTSGSGVLGIDVSKWNGSIDWNEVKNSGINFVIIRCGFRGSSSGALVEDVNFRSYIKGAQAAGLKVGVYFFTQAVNEVEAVEEASMVLSLIGGYNINYPVFLDVESSGGRGDRIDASTRTAVCKAFCQTVANSGYKAGVYANKTWFTSNINTGSIANYKIWLAQYSATPTYSATRYDMWQYSSKGKVGGISGNVDMDISYMGY